MSDTRATELLEAVRQFLKEDLLQELEGFNAYSTRVAANALDIVARELVTGPDLQRIDAEYAEQLGIDEKDGPLGVQLARGLREGSLEANAELLDYLKRRTLKKLEIDNPRYSGYLRAKGSAKPGS